MTRVRTRCALSLLAPISLGAVAFGSVHAAEPSVPMSALKKCADIVSIQERVACYDQLAERPAKSERTAATSERSTTSDHPATAAAAPPATAAAAPSATPAAAPKEAFGLYSAEHPAAPPAKVAGITAKIVSIGTGSSGHPIVTLEGDQVWELDAGDPLLKSGDAVKIERAMLGSFIMTTPTGRTHRLHRLR